MWTPMLYRTLLRHTQPPASNSRKSSLASPPESFSTPAADGYRLNGFVWRHSVPNPARSLVIINPATAVRCRYYFRFADYLFRHGMDVVTFDYRGIGESRPQHLCGFRAGWADWGRLDFEAVLNYAREIHRGQPIDVVAHSIGGFVIGLAPSNCTIRRIFTVGAQFAHWRDYADVEWVSMILKWHVTMPVLTAILGYFPGKRFGWLEDVPAGVVRDWSRMGQRFDLSLARGDATVADAMRRQFAAVTAPILAVAASDDPFGTPVAVDRLLTCFTRARTHHRRIDPVETGYGEIGHFGFFHDRFEPSLWPMARDWLVSEVLPAR